MDYRKELYSNYVSSLASYLYRGSNLENFKKQFSVWRKYYNKFLPKAKEIRILDLGCGAGEFLFYLQELGYKDSFGIDVSHEQIELAKKLGIKNVEVIDLNEFLKEQKEVYNVIFARDIIEHFRKEEILKIMKFIYNVLSENGKLIIQSINAESPFGIKYLYGDFTHEAAFTQTSLHQILWVAGFRKIEFYPTGPVIHGINSAIRYFLWKMIELFFKFYMLVETGSGKGIFTQNLICIAEK